MLDTIPHSDFWALQETHLPGSEQMATAQRWSRKRGWAAFLQSAEVVGEHYAANRGGVAMGGPQHISSSVPTEFEGMLGEAALLAPEGLEHPLQYLRSRILARHFHAMLKRGVTLVTVYLEPGLRASGLNLWLLEVLAACILCFDGPWIAMGDWNMEPQELAQAGWLDTVNGKVAATSAATCAGGAGAVLDYFVLSEAMAHLVQQVKVVVNSPTTPHSPVCLTLMATSWGHRVLARKRPKPFPTQVPVGPRRQEEQFDWTWAAEEMPADLELAWLEWLRAAEAAWCRIHDLCGTQRRPFLGRSKGLVIEHVSLGQATRNDTRRRCSKKAAAWRAFRRLVAQAVGSVAGWRKGRASQGTLQQSVNLLASISLPDLGPWDPGWDFPSQEAVAHSLRKAATCGDWAAQVTRVMVFVKLHTQQAVNAAAADSARCWRQWAKEACQGSAGAAHGFSKAGLDAGDGEGLAGPQLLVNQMGTWLPLWLDPRRANAKQLADQEDMGEPLPRPSLEEVDNVCKTYKHTAGLGHDCINPKAILQLPVDLRVRFIDLLMMFEAKLVKPLNWSHMMVLRPKPSGGHRTIGLTVAPLRVLSRLRRPLAQQWENEHDAPYFWGCQGKACDRAAWAHSIMVAAAKGRQQSAASLLLDLAKFYEHVGHDHLCSPHDCWLVGAPRTKVGGFWRPTSAPLFPSGPLGPFFQVAVGQQRRQNSCWQPFWKQWQQASRLTGSGTWSTTFRGTWRALPRWCKSSQPRRPGFWWKASRHAICRSPRASPKSSSTVRTSSSMPFCSSWRCSGSTSAIRHATWGPTCSWAGGDGRSSSRAGWRGLRRERSASGSYARQGHTLASSP